MPEYLAPGVYVEEVSFRPQTIEGVSTSTTGFVGPARFGPTQGEPALLTSFADFERIYGGLDQLAFNGNGTLTPNYLAHAVRAYFEEGGKRLYVSRVYEASSGSDGHAGSSVDRPDSPAATMATLRARYPGACGAVPVTFTFNLGQNILAGQPADPTDPAGNTVPALRGAGQYDVVWVRDLSSPIDSPPGETGTLYWLSRKFEAGTGRYTFDLKNPNGDLTLSSLTPGLDYVGLLTVTVTVGAMGKFGEPQTYESLALDPRHPNGLTAVFASQPKDRATALYVPLVFSTPLSNGAALAEGLLAQPSLRDDSQTVQDFLNDSTVGETARAFQVLLQGGSDGARPAAAVYAGADGSQGDGLKSGLRVFEDLDNISIVAAPGATAGYESAYQSDADTIIRHLISHCERMRYRIGVLDSAENHLLAGVRAFRGQLDSKYAALYYPWIRILDPITEQEINVPPSGHVAGIYARNDVDHGVHKAPANEVVRLAIGFERLLNKAQQDVLNPEGVNCFRFFEGRGYLLWGARTISSEGEWKYVNLRRYFAYLERSIDTGTKWAVFENNGSRLWANVRRTVEDFLLNEWVSGRLMGATPAEAFFVRCDRSTMTQNDIDNGRLICLIGVAPLRPAEFVIFRIGQKLVEMQA